MDPSASYGRRQRSATAAVDVGVNPIKCTSEIEPFVAFHRSPHYRLSSSAAPRAFKSQRTRREKCRLLRGARHEERGAAEKKPWRDPSSARHRGAERSRWIGSIVAGALGSTRRTAINEPSGPRSQDADGPDLAARLTPPSLRADGLDCLRRCFPTGRFAGRPHRDRRSLGLRSSLPRGCSRSARSRTLRR